MKYAVEIGGALATLSDRDAMRAHVIGALLATQEQPDLAAAAFSADSILNAAAEVSPDEVVIERLYGGRKLIAWTER